MKYCFGIDVGGTTIKAGLFTEEGSLLEQWSLPTRIGGNSALIYDDVAETVKQKLAERGISREECLGVGLDMPGSVYDDGRFGFGNNIETLGGYPAQELSERLAGMKTVLANDANAAAFGEYWMGAGKDYRSICMVTLGTGVGGGIIVDGQLVNGAHGSAGEIGHFCMEPQEPEACNCGGHGCLEYYASATGLVRVAKRMLQSGNPRTPLVKGQCLKYPEHPMAKLGEALSAKDICDLAAAGDELANQVLDFTMDLLGRALAFVQLTTDPEVFVIGGGVAGAGEILFTRLRKAIRDYSRLIREEERPVIGAKLGSKAGIYGAAALLIAGTR